MKKQNKQNLQNKSDIGTDDNATGFKKNSRLCVMRDGEQKSMNGHE